MPPYDALMRNEDDKMKEKLALNIKVAASPGKPVAEDQLGGPNSPGEQNLLAYARDQSLAVSTAQDERNRKIMAALETKRKAEEDLRVLSAKRPHVDTDDIGSDVTKTVGGPFTQSELQALQLAKQDSSTLSLFPTLTSASLAQQQMASASLAMGADSLALHRLQGLQGIPSGFLGQHPPVLTLAQPYAHSPLSPFLHQQTLDTYRLAAYSNQFYQEQQLRNAALAQAQAASFAQLPAVGVPSPILNAPSCNEAINSILARGNASALLRQTSAPVGNAPASSRTPKPAGSGLASTTDEPKHQAPYPALNQHILPLPPCDEGKISVYSSRGKYPLGIDEDPNWLSEFHCFVRMDMIEVFRASQEDCKSRNNSIMCYQVGIRCRFCAHLSPGSRTGRSSAFPSSLRQIYQSFTMMLRDHFGSCQAVPPAVRQRFLTLKEMPSQGATDSKRFWIYSAMKIGMADSRDGIIISERSIAAGRESSSFGTDPDQAWPDDALRSIPIVLERDRTLVNEFLMTLMSQVQVVHLTESEKIGNRRSLETGLPGFGCRFCCENRRLGLCRMFPARRRTLPSKINDLYDHVRRCTLVPQQVKDHLERLKIQMSCEPSDRDEEKEFFDRIWTRIGHSSSGN